MLSIIFLNIRLILLGCVFITSVSAQAFADPSLKNLQTAYPEHIQSVTSNYVIWKDGTKMRIQHPPSMIDWITNLFYQPQLEEKLITQKEIQRQHYESIFKKMYGGTPAEVKQNLTIIYWMPHVFGKIYPLRVTTVNDIDKKLQRISDELEKLPFTYYKYLSRPAGSFYWRHVKGESYLSTHSFGIAIDINSHYANYWLWDYQKTHRPLAELRSHTLSYQNRIPDKIINIFEKEGFYWGGRWYFYDTMHFEYRPDLLLKNA